MRAYEIFGRQNASSITEDAAQSIADATRRKSAAAHSYQSKLRTISASDRHLASTSPSAERRYRTLANNEKRAKAKAQYQAATARAEETRRAAMAKLSKP